MNARDEGAADRPVVEIDGAHRSFGDVRALDNVSCAIAKGEMFGVIGPDGAGKTTLLRLVCGLIAPDAGSVRVFGEDPFRARRSATAAIGYVSQQFSLYGDLSIDENIEFFALLHGVTDFAGRRDRLLNLTGLTRFRSRLADRLSGGMKQKLALACTLVHEPPLLVLDEPTTGVDPVSRREFWKLLGEFVEQGLTIVLATPYLDEAERCSRIVMLHEGQRLAMDAPQRLQAAMGGAMLEVVVDAPRQALEALSGAPGVEGLEVFGDRLHVRVADPARETDVRRALDARGLGAADVRRITPGLEDVFIEYVTVRGTSQTPARPDAR